MNPGSESMVVVGRTIVPTILLVADTAAAETVTRRTVSPSVKGMLTVESAADPPGPVAPVAPAPPLDPVAPVAPWVPEPVAPVVPCGPVGPVDPCDPSSPSRP